MKFRVFIAAAAATLGACAASAPALRGADASPREKAGVQSPEQLLAAARAQRVEDSCIAALPVYRVVAAMGAGQEAAQHELGECLISAAGAAPAETALLHREGMFWLERAAWAGNARAQRLLALHYGAGDSADRDPRVALQWALVYDDNDEAELYGYGALPATYIPGLAGELGEAGAAAAQSFAANFAPVAMPAFEPPAPERPAVTRAGPPENAGRPRGGRRRPG